jgi:hypothetical protein
MNAKERVGAEGNEVGASAQPEIAKHSTGAGIAVLLRGHAAQGPQRQVIARSLFMVVMVARFAVYGSTAWIDAWQLAAMTLTASK